jgi:hypothetical protein
MAEAWGIRRSDGEWYAGTADHAPIYGPKNGAARFSTVAAAELRCNGLRGRETDGRTLLVERLR